MMSRFHALLDRVVTPYRGKIRYLSIGNEVDAYLRANPPQWTTYQRFYEDAARYARSLDPGLQIGVTGTFDALTLSPTPLQNLNAASDVLFLTYYPLAMGLQRRGFRTFNNSSGPALSFRTK